MARQAKTRKPSASEDSCVPAEDLVAAKQPIPNEAETFPVVGIGASAGGLAAFEAFFSGMPADAKPGMAFVLVQHLAPDHKSILTELITRYTSMAVFEVEDGMVVRPNCAYIIPPNRDMAFINGTLQLLEPSAPRGQRLPIDFFFRSLADDQHERAICIVLSGTGSDGTLGLRAIKGEGGMAMAQNPESTEFDGMPRSAIDTGLVDFVLPPAEMPAALMSFASHAFLDRPLPAPQLVPHGEEELKKVFVLLRARSGNDFSLYKQTTVMRRIERRMAVNQVERLEDYVRHLQRDPSEVDALFRDLLIGVTNFFRNPEVFEALRAEVVVPLLDGKHPGDTVRVWVPACSTGEEAYSLAILLHERMEELKSSFDVKVFATDIDANAVSRARAGSYPDSISADVTPERLKRYFIRNAEDGTYRVQKVIRDMIIFSEQNVLKDPPFSRLDLISCRNLLIYMSPALQAKLIPLFHYALNGQGYLCVGTSESVCGFTDLFTIVDAKAKLYRSRDEASVLPGLPSRPTPSHSRSREPIVTAQGPRPYADAPLRALVEQEVLKRPRQVAALVNAKGDILYLHGRSGPYLEPSPGTPVMNILKMAREGLGRDLAVALRKAQSQVEPVIAAGLMVRTNGDFTPTDLTVKWVDNDAELGSDAAYYLVFLEEARRGVESASPPVADGETPGVDVDARIAQLNQELRAKEEYLQTTLEEMETTNEELQSTNEELQSVNEELQSTNEELETSKEELQSVNEELATVNAELQQRVNDLSRANNDMNNLLAGTGIGTIFVDNELRIQRFTPAAARVINLILSDVGRPVGHIMSNLVGYDTLVSDVQSVLDSLESREAEVQTIDGEWYLLRIRPYRTVDNVIDGAAITFTDITELKRAQQIAFESEAISRLAAVVKDSGDAIVMCDPTGTILAWNPAASRIYGWTEQQALERNIRDLMPEGEREKVLSTAANLAKSSRIEAVETHALTRDGREVAITLATTALLDEDGKTYAYSITQRELDRDD